MQKVGIATMCGGDNYGNALQNYAVQTLIDNLGYQAITLNNQTKSGFPNRARLSKPLWKKLTPRYIAAYRRARLTDRYGCKNDRELYGAGLRKAKKAYQDTCAAKQKRHEKFIRFRAEQLHIDDTSIKSENYDKEHLSSFYAFVCGSDQVWNPYFQQNSMLDFLQFAPPNKRIAFAPSFGVSEIPHSRQAEYARWLREIPALSVREQAGAEIIRALTGREATVLLDPTFGLTAEQWQRFERKPQSAPQSSYVLCYFLGNRCRKYSKWIARYAKQTGCTVVDVCDIFDLQHYDIDPCEFVWLLRHAEAVFTDSFHGTAFSINLEIPFVVFERGEGGASMSSRITTVLDKTGLADRLFPTVSPERVRRIDFTRARQAISDARTQMLDYLATALRQVGECRQPFLAERRHCTGCGACKAACPSGAITMQRDSEGFLYPQIDETKCLHCNACERACPQDRAKPEREAPQAFYAYAKDAQVCRSSSSGGVFTLLATHILQQGGVVFGAGYDERFGICHQMITSVQDIALLRTSKYVQSDLRETYQQAKRALTDGKKVLFTGTPCQIAGLKQFLGRDCEALYTQDIICHGVPSPMTWETYLTQCHQGHEIEQINFRDKTIGWNEFAMRIGYRDGGAYCVRATQDPFERAFLGNLNLRPSCYQCQYKTLSRESDITLADYWGVELPHPQLQQQQGISLLLIHTEKGKALYDAISPQLHTAPTDRDRAISYNRAALNSVGWHKNRDEFFSKLQAEPFDQLVRRCLKQPVSRKLYRIIKRTGSKVKRLFIKRKG